MVKNKCGYELIEYIPCCEQDIINYKNVTSEFKRLIKKKRPNGEIIYTAIFLCIKDNIVPFVKYDNNENYEIIQF